MLDLEADVWILPGANCIRRSGGPGAADQGRGGIPEHPERLLIEDRECEEIHGCRSFPVGFFDTTLITSKACKRKPPPRLTDEVTRSYSPTDDGFTNLLRYSSTSPFMPAELSIFLTTQLSTHRLHHVVPAKRQHFYLTRTLTASTLKFILMVSSAYAFEQHPALQNLCSGPAGGWRVVRVDGGGEDEKP